MGNAVSHQISIRTGWIFAMGVAVKAPVSTRHPGDLERPAGGAMRCETATR